MAAERFLPPGKLEAVSVVDTTWQQELVSTGVMSLPALSLSLAGGGGVSTKYTGRPHPPQEANQQRTIPEVGPLMGPSLSEWESCTCAHVGP